MSGAVPPPGVTPNPDANPDGNADAKPGIKTDGKAAAETPKRPPPRSARRRAREFALQGLYQWLLSRAEPAEVEAHIRDLDDFAKCDRAHFDALLHGCIAQAAALDAVLMRHIDRPVVQLSPVEHGVLMIGVYELTHCIEIPYRVAINEAVELAKSFGGTDGHKYVNGVLDKASADLRPNEARQSRRPAAPAAAAAKDDEV